MQQPPPVAPLATTGAAPLSNSSSSSKRMSRLRAEKLIAQAYRIPNPERPEELCGQQLQQQHRHPPTSRGSFQGATGAAGRPRPVARVPSRSAGTALTPASLSHELYLQQSGVQFYVEDIVKRLQEQRPEHPAMFIANYFASVAKGTHVSGRAFEYVNGTLQNRAAFLAQLQKTFANVDMNMQLTLEDFTELIWCQCRDFPVQLLHQAAYHLKDNDDMNQSVRTTLRAFLASFGACFFYSEFLSRAHDIYGEMQATKDGRAASPRSSARAESIANAMAADRVVARLRVVAQQNTFSIPPMLEIESLVYKSNTFKEFCARFFDSATIAASVLDLERAFASCGK